MAAYDAVIHSAPSVEHELAKLQIVVVVRGVPTLGPEKVGRNEKRKRSKGSQEEPEWLVEISVVFGKYPVSDSDK
jgi:hypothetical protein